MDLDTLRARIEELESRNMTFAPMPVRVRWEFDLKAFKMLLELLERKA